MRYNVDKINGTASNRFYVLPKLTWREILQQAYKDRKPKRKKKKNQKKQSQIETTIITFNRAKWHASILKTCKSQTILVMIIKVIVMTRKTRYVLQ